MNKGEYFHEYHSRWAVRYGAVGLMCVVGSFWATTTLRGILMLVIGGVFAGLCRRHLQFLE